MQTVKIRTLLVPSFRHKTSKGSLLSVATVQECSWSVNTVECEGRTWRKLLNRVASLACGNNLYHRNPFSLKKQNFVTPQKNRKKWLSWVSWKCISLRGWKSENSDENQMKIRLQSNSWKSDENHMKIRWKSDENQMKIRIERFWILGILGSFESKV